MTKHIREIGTARCGTCGRCPCPELEPEAFEKFNRPVWINIFAPTKAEADAVVQVGFREMRASERYEVRTHSLLSPASIEGMRHRPGIDRVIVANTYPTVLSRPSPGMGYYEGLAALLRNLAKASYPLKDVELVFLSLEWRPPVL